MAKRSSSSSRPSACIPYYRVSTDKQGRSGLGLEAQELKVTAWAESRGRTALTSYTEVESGRTDDRPELLRALAHAKRAGATLVVANISRLTRDTQFLLGLRDSGADIAFCDLPEIEGPIGRFMLTVMVAVAELEAGLISERTRLALAAYKARGGLLGASRPECRTLTPQARQRGAESAGRVSAEQARAAYSDIAPLMQQLRAEGLTLAQIANRLTTDGHTTRGKKPWNAVQVMRVLRQAAPSDSPPPRNRQ